MNRYFVTKFYRYFRLYLHISIIYQYSFQPEKQVKWKEIKNDTFIKTIAFDWIQYRTYFKGSVSNLLDWLKKVPFKITHYCRNVHNRNESFFKYSNKFYFLCILPFKKDLQSNSKRRGLIISCLYFQYIHK